MKRNLTIFALFCAINAVLAVGPKFPFMLTYVPSPSTGVTGYWFYWRTLPTGEFNDTNRYPISTNNNIIGTDMRVLGLPKGQYMTAMSATNRTSESPLSPEYLWDYTHPTAPGQHKLEVP